MDLREIQEVKFRTQSYFECREVKMSSWLWFAGLNEL